MVLNIGVLALQGAVSEHLALIKKCGAKGIAVRKQDDLKDISGLIIPGGESTTIGMLMQSNGISQMLIEKSREGMPLYGTCAGMVLLAKNVVDGYAEQPLLGLMDITVKRNAFGRQRESFEEDILIKDLDIPVPGVFIRAPVITDAGSGVKVLAAMPEGIIAARQDNYFVTSFHPELTDDLTVHQYFINMCKR